MDTRGAFRLPETVYLDTATWGLPPAACADAMRAALDAQQAGRARWVEDWDRPAESCRTDFASLIGAAASDVALLPASSVGVGLVAERLRPGDDVVVPADEYTSVLFPLLVAARAGVRVRQVAFDELADEVRRGTRLVAFSLVQMQTGKVAPVASILDAAEAAGAEVLVDATQALPFVDVPAARVHYLVCSAYKHLLSPRGVAFLYVRADRHDALEPWNANWRAADDPYGRYFGGPLTLRSGAARFDVSLAWLPWIGARESLRLLAGWKRDGTLAEPLALARALARETGIAPAGATLVCVPVAEAVRAGEALEAAGIRASVRGTSVRFAPHVYNDASDVHRAAEALRAVAAVHA
ncbi:MAG TPA: aminotransferase class V-fold PLP-dependent enzyme [Candidatus Limnocylindria bacterium]|nr:aminotransferase class V-fold PLP-dependent enzyme [Candidatus Limnocylindria bacterium]